MYYIQAKCEYTANKNPNVVNDDKDTFNYGWPYTCGEKYLQETQVKEIFFEEQFFRLQGTL